MIIIGNRSGVCGQCRVQIYIRKANSVYNAMSTPEWHQNNGFPEFDNSFHCVREVICYIYFEKCCFLSDVTCLLRRFQQKWKPICLNESGLANKRDCGGAFSLGQFDIMSSSNNSHFFSRMPSSFLTGFWMTTFWITCESHTTNGFLITLKITISTG